MNKDYVTVSKLGSGWAALHLSYYDDIKGYDVQQTGIGRYATREEAEREARNWSISDEIELRLSK